MTIIHRQAVLSYARFKGPIRFGFSISSTRIGLFAVGLSFGLPAGLVVDLLLV